MQVSRYLLSSEATKKVRRDCVNTRFYISARELHFRKRRHNIDKGVALCDLCLVK